VGGEERGSGTRVNNWNGVMERERIPNLRRKKRDVTRRGATMTKKALLIWRGEEAERGHRRRGKEEAQA